MHTFKRSTLIDWVTVLPAYLEFAMAHSDAQTGTRLHFLRCVPLP